MALSQATEYIKYIEKELKQDIVSMKEKDILVQSKNREEAKKKVEKLLRTKKVPFKSVFKKSKSGSLDVLSIANFDIVFKQARKFVDKRGFKDILIISDLPSLWFIELHGAFVEVELGLYLVPFL
jgi:hypothetical protein